MNGQNAAENGAGTVTLTQKKTVKLAKMAMLVAISLLLVNIHFPIFPPIAFMEYDPADIDWNLCFRTGGGNPYYSGNRFAARLYCKCRQRTIRYIDAHYSNWHICACGRLYIQIP